MDKIEIIFMGQESSLYEYKLRILENLNWFIITRFNNENNNHETDMLIYNGNTTLLYGYLFKNDKKITKHYSAKQNDEIPKNFMRDLLNYIGINSFSLKLLDKLNFDTGFLKKKYWKHYYFNRNIKYLLKEETSDNDAYEKKYDIYDNENKIGEIYLNDGNSKIIVFPNHQIDISRLYKSKIYKLNRENVLKRSKKL